MLVVLIRYLLNKYCINIHLELWVLLFALYFLWFSSDDYLEQNMRLTLCTLRFLIFARLFLNFEDSWEMLMALIIGNFFIMIIPFSDSMSIIPQILILCVCIRFVANSLYFFRHATHFPLLITFDWKNKPTCLGNYSYFIFFSYYIKLT